MLHRRTFLSSTALLPLAAKAAPAPDNTVHFTGDGVALTPRAHAQLLARLAEEREIAPDSYSQNGIVAELEARMAKLLGKEYAVFLPSGTLANHLALRILANGGKVLVQQESHLYNDEGDCAQRLSGLNLVPLAPGKAAFTLADVEEQVDRAEHGRVAAPVGVISIESPVRRMSGEVVPFDQMKSIAAYARKQGIKMHLDGARIFLAAPYAGITPAQYASLFDTVYVSLYKYFNASFGTILAGPRSLLENLYHARRMFGGGLPHVWPQAAVALHYLDGFESRFARAVSVSEELFTELASHPGCRIRRVAPGTNIAFAHIPARDPEAFRKSLASAGILIAPPQPVSGGIEVSLSINETILRRPPADLARAFPT